MSWHEDSSMLVGARRTGICYHDRSLERVALRVTSWYARIPRLLPHQAANTLQEFWTRALNEHVVEVQSGQIVAGVPE